MMLKSKQIDRGIQKKLLKFEYFGFEILRETRYNTQNISVLNEKLSESCETSDYYANIVSFRIAFF